MFRLKSLSHTAATANPANSATRVATLATVAVATDNDFRHGELGRLSPAQEAARQQLLALLAANPTVQRAFCNRFENGALILTLAIRDIGTCELLIPAGRFNSGSLHDYAALLACLAPEPHPTPSFS